jgi:hypothetical protein
VTIGSTIIGPQFGGGGGAALSVAAVFLGFFRLLFFGFFCASSSDPEFSNSSKTYFGLAGLGGISMGRGRARGTSAAAAVEWSGTAFEEYAGQSA